MLHLGNLKFADFADVTSAISGLMTILGVGGLVSWSLFRKQRGTFAENSISVFAFSVKTGTCVLLLWPMSLLFFGLHIFVVLSIGPGAIGQDDFFWNPQYPVAYMVSYVVNVLLWAPLYILFCACIFTWSLGPFRVFWDAIRGK